MFLNTCHIRVRNAILSEIMNLIVQKSHNILENFIAILYPTTIMVFICSAWLQANIWYHSSN